MANSIKEAAERGGSRMRTRMDADSLRRDADGKGLADARTTLVLQRRAIFAETETSTTGGRTNTKKEGIDGW